MKSYYLIMVSIVILILLLIDGVYIYRLGHKEQKDEWSPRHLDFFTKNNVVPSNAVVFVGSVNCAVTAGMSFSSFE